MTPPQRLLAVPAFFHELTIKATHSGITVLKDGRYKKRYTGSRTAAVSINGDLYLKQSDLKAAVDAKCSDRAIKKGLRSSAQPHEVPAGREHESKGEKLPTKQCGYKVN